MASNFTHSNLLTFLSGKKSPYLFSTDIMICFENKELAQETFLKPPLIKVNFGN